MQHIHRVPGLERVCSAVVVEMQLAANVAYHTLPAPQLLSPACDPPPPPIILWLTGEALGLLLPPGEAETGTFAQGQVDTGCSHMAASHHVLMLVAALTPVCVSAVAARDFLSSGHVGWRQPCALHVEVEGEGRPLPAALHNALALMRDAAAQWPLVKVQLHACTLADTDIIMLHFSCL